MTANLLTGLGIDEFFTRTDGVGARALLPDALGSAIALSDGTGTIQTQYTYEPFGVTTQTGAGSMSSYKYIGREDDGTGLYYYRARYYQPRFQRFVSADPIGFAGRSINLYEYAINNPLNWIDAIGQAAMRRSPNNGPKNPKEPDDPNSKRGGTIQPEPPIPPVPQRSKFCEGAYNRCLNVCNSFCPKKFLPTCQSGCFALYLLCITAGGDRDGDGG